MYSTIFLFLGLWMIYCINVYAAAEPMWKVNDLVDDVKNKPLSALVSELKQKATGEFDKLYHQLEGVLGRLSGGDQGVEAELDPRLLSECSCYCRCPHDTVDTKVMAEVKDAVADLKRKVESVGESLREKIHEVTSG